MSKKTESDSWKLILPCTRQEAEMLNGEVPQLTLLEYPPVIMTEELTAFDDRHWQIHAYFQGEPDPAAVAMLQALIPSALGVAPVIEQLPHEDWVTLSQSGIKPVRAGCFFVHTSTFTGSPPAGTKSFLIEASRAFGTGSHETTAGCLAMLDLLKGRGARFDHLADIGTGTGLLAFAAHHLWPRATLTASDIDPVSIDISADNAAVNSVLLGRGGGRLALCVASGTNHPMVQRRAPYDLVIANILAGPLIELAPSLTAILAEGGTLILAGLLDTQADAVAEAYWRCGLRLAERRDTGDWPCLRLIKRRRSGWRRPLRSTGVTTQPPGDFGTW